MAHTSKSICFLCTFLLCVCHLQYFSSGRDNFSAGNWIHDGDEIVSAGKIFRMGFFTLYGNIRKDRKYVGIRYRDSPDIKVWVANREEPIPSNISGSFGIDAESGNLKVCDSGNTCTYFSTNVYVRPQVQRYSTTAKLHDNGNLVLTDDQTGEIVWESFKNPTDTFLPGMKMEEKLNLTSWKSDDDPALGNFSFVLDHEEFNGGYSIMKYGFQPYWKSGGESTNSFISKQMSVPASLLLSNITTSNTSRRVGRSRLWMQSNGDIQYLNWDNVTMIWSVLWSEPKGHACSFFRACGSSARCSPDPHNPTVPLCTCFPGFEPTNEENWKSGDRSEGCKKKSSECTPSNTSFVQLNVTMVRSNTPAFNVGGADVDCTSICQKECTCQAFSNTSKINNRGIGCWFWFGNLNDVQEGPDGDHVIFIRVDRPSDLTSDGNQQRNSSFPPAAGDQGGNMKPSTLRRIIISTSVIFAVALLCSITCISYRRVVAKRKGDGIIRWSKLQNGDCILRQFSK